MASTLVTGSLRMVSQSRIRRLHSLSFVDIRCALFSKFLLLSFLHIVDLMMETYASREYRTMSRVLKGTGSKTNAKLISDFTCTFIVCVDGRTVFGAPPGMPP